MPNTASIGFGGLGGLGGIDVSTEFGTSPGGITNPGASMIAADRDTGFGDFGLKGAQGFTMRDPWSDFWGSTPAFQNTFGNFIGDLRQTAPSAFPFTVTETQRRPGEAHFKPGSTHTSGEAMDISMKGLPGHAQESILQSIARTFPLDAEIDPVASHIHAGLRQAWGKPHGFHGEPAIASLVDVIRAAQGHPVAGATQFARDAPTDVPTPTPKPAPPMEPQPTTPTAGVPLPAPRPNVGPHASPPAAAVPTPTPRPQTQTASVPVPRDRPQTASERFNQAFPTPTANPMRGEETDWFQMGSKVFESLPERAQRALSRIAQQLDTTPEAVAYATSVTPNLDYRTVTGLNPTTQLGLQFSGLPQAHPGAAWGYSPFGFAQVYSGAPEHVQTAATGPGLFGALGFGWGGLGGLGGASAGGDGLSEATMNEVGGLGASGAGGLW